MPTDLAGPCGTADSCEAELRDGQTLLCGRESEAASVLWSRIHHSLERFPVLDHFKGRLHSSGATKEMLERLMIGMEVPAGSPLVRTWELARDLERRGKSQAVRDLFAAGSTVSAVVDEVLDSHITTAGAATVPDSGGGGGSEGERGHNSLVGSMEQKEFERAVGAPNFVSAYETIQQSSGIKVLDAAATSGSVLMLRYLFWTPSWMRPRHAAFDTMGKHIADRADYLAYCSTVSADTETVPAHLSTYRLTDTLNEKFWSCNWADMDMVNASAHAPHEGGFLALRFLDQGTVYSSVTASDFYTVETTLMGIRDWFTRLLLGVGFAATPDDGYSWADVVERQLELVRYINGLPNSERTSWRQWAADNFITHALTRAQTLFKSKLSTSRPADEVITCFLPDDAAFFSNISAKLEDAKPIAVVRRAFPSYFPSEPVTLPGTTPSSSRQASSSQGGGGSRGAGQGRSDRAGGGGGTPNGKNRMSELPDAPGSKAALAKMLPSGHLFIAAKVCDVHAVAEHLKVKPEDHCWPVLFSTKKGEAALALCPEPDKHGGVNSRWHKPPKNFDQARLLKKFWSAASADQLREAGWRSAKKKKT